MKASITIFDAETLRRWRRSFAGNRRSGGDKSRTLFRTQSGGVSLVAIAAYPDASGPFLDLVTVGD